MKGRIPSGTGPLMNQDPQGLGHTVSVPCAEFEIERGVPLPERSRTARGNLLGRTPKYPWAEMKAGDSFLIPDCTLDMRNSVNAAAAHQRRLHGSRFVMRKQDDGLRVWRVA